MHKAKRLAVLVDAALLERRLFLEWLNGKGT